MVSLQKTQSFLRLFLLTMLGLGLVQPSYGQTYQAFQRKHVDSQGTGGTNTYCNTMMQNRGMTAPTCKGFNTFIHESLPTILNICNNPNVRCRDNTMNCHGGTATVTDCQLTGGASPNCRYQATKSTRPIVIACNGNPLVPVHFDR